MIKVNSIFNIPIFIYENIFLKNVLAKTKLIICSSDYIRNDFLKSYKYKSITINPGVDVVRKLVKKTAETKIVLFVASLMKSQRHKGLEYLLQAFVLVRRQLKDAQLIVVGDGDAVTEYRKLSKWLGFRKSVVFAGSLYGEKLNQMFSKANVLVLPSLKDSFGMVLIEAMVQGTPVIGTKVGGIPDIITHGKDGFLVPARDTHKLAKSIIKILKDKSMANSMGIAGYEKVKKKYLWRMQIKKTHDIFEGMLT